MNTIINPETNHQLTSRSLVFHGASLPSCSLFKRVVPLVAIVGLLASCSEKTTQEMKGVEEPVAEKPVIKDSVTVTRIGLFEDSLAYKNKRGIYRIVDNKTGKEYIGVSGIGISEVGLHSTGKAVVPDER